MELIILIIALAMTCFAGVQFCYLMFLQAQMRQQRRRIRELEREVSALLQRQESFATQAELSEAGDEVWSELIDDSAG